ncbi:MAG: hypothetical protein IPH42_08770 [Bacteroidetes bacterium]|nr:hypothetical protein [Bacteroidota bacterium]
MKNAALIIVGGLMILTASCRKSNFIGEELLPEEDFLNSTRVDTFKIVTYTETDDSVVTSQNVFLHWVVSAVNGMAIPPEIFTLR